MPEFLLLRLYTSAKKHTRLVLYESTHTHAKTTISTQHIEIYLCIAYFNIKESKHRAIMGLMYMYSAILNHSGTLMYSVILSHSGMLIYSAILSHSGTLLNVQCNTEPFWHANVQYNTESF